MRFIPTPVSDAKPRFRFPKSPTERRGSVRASAKTILWVNLVLIAATTFAATRFNFPETVLSEKSWGAGTPSGSCITAFATLRPWWLTHLPYPVVESPSGGIEHETRIPRDAIETRSCRVKCKVKPERGIGYEAFLGAVTALRSLFSDELIFDFALFVQLQQLLLVLSLAAVPYVLYRAVPEFRTEKIFPAYLAATLVLAVVRPNKNEFLTEGIIDSALANACAVFGVAALFIVRKTLALESRKDVFRLAAASLYLSWCPLVRGEFLIVYGFVYMFLFAVIVLNGRRELAGLALSFVLLCSLPVGYGLCNKAIFGRFVPLRTHFGQNLYEPVGQYPNPWGIEYLDAWLWDYLDRSGVKYGSPEEDAFLVGKYLDRLRENPGLFFDNFRKRLEFFSGKFGYPFNVVTVPVALAALLWASRRDRRFQYVALPGVAAVGYLLYFGWTNSLLRCVTPVHFLLVVFWCVFTVYLVNIGVLDRSAKYVEAFRFPPFRHFKSRWS